MDIGEDKRKEVITIEPIPETAPVQEPVPAERPVQEPAEPEKVPV